MSDHMAYTVGWICALECEFVAALNFLDDRHEDLAFSLPQDSNSYQLGQINHKVGKHNIVIAVFPKGSIGRSAATSVATNMLRSFPNIKVCLMVGIGGGVPTREDIRLGDVVVSAPQEGLGGVIQYDFGHERQNEGFKTDGFLNQPPQTLLSAVSKLAGIYKSDRPQFERLEQPIQKILENKPHLMEEFARPDSDMLFHSTYLHGSMSKAVAKREITNPDGSQAQYRTALEKSDCKICCDSSRLIERAPRRGKEHVKIHYGLIASGDKRMKNAEIRDKLAIERNVLCFEMEAAGLMNGFPCLVIRGICDYSDSHKNDEWQGYAAMIAAAYAKDLLHSVPPTKVEAERNIADIPGILSASLATLMDMLVNKDINEISSNGRVTRETVQLLKFEETLKSMHTWLSSPDPSLEHNAALKQRHGRSGDWLLGSAAFHRWKTREDSNSVLCIQGATGRGKTILSSTIIDNLEKDSLCQPVLYFYFSFQDAKKQRVENMMRALITQLSVRHAEASEYLKILYSSCENGRRQPTYQQLCEAFLQMVEHGEKIWLVIDAINECVKGIDELFPWIKELLDTKTSGIHMIVTSQPGTDIGIEMETLAFKDGIISLHNSSVADDISDFIRVTIQEDPGFARWKQSPGVQGEISTRISGKADGMYAVRPRSHP
ncbi:hypothetical protein ABW19_dt0203028 [Dactylella cylindrospora]|nr:hypothetical protein ABW19_dt0203028 [Dactylella cylindrospora]